MGETDVIKLHLERALTHGHILICSLKVGLCEFDHLYEEKAVLFNKIEFQPKAYLNGYYIGFTVFPNGKYQGLMHFDENSFLSAVCLEDE